MSFLVVAAVESGSASLPWGVKPSVWLVMGGVLTFLWWSITKVGPRVVAVGEEVITTRQKQWIAAGVVWTWIFSEWPIHDISEKYLFIVHMLQHTVFTLVAPACFLLGAPPWMWRWLLSKAPILLVARFFSKPIVSLLFFNALIAVTHFPSVVGLATRNGPFHFLVHLTLFVSAIFMWVPVINRTDLLPKFKTPTKMIYLFAQSIVPTVPASFLTFAQTPMYEHYANAPRLIAGLGAREDQQWAAVIMKLGAGTYIWGIVGYLFYTWWIDSEAGRADDNLKPVPDSLGTGTLTWDRVRAEFDRIDANAFTAATSAGPSATVPSITSQRPTDDPETKPT